MEQEQNSSMFGLRYVISLLLIVYRIAIVTSIVSLISESNIKLALPLILTQLFFLASSIFIILSNYQTQGFLNTVLRELIYFISNRNDHTQDQFKWDDTFSILSKVYCHFLETIILMLIIIFNQERNYILDQVAQMLNFLLLVLLIEIFFTKKQSLTQLLFNVFLKFSVRSLFLGQFLLCHRSIYFFIFDLIIVLLFMGFSGIEELQQNAFKFGYKHDEPKEKLSSMFPENFILPPISFGIHFIRTTKIENEEQEVEKENIFSGMQVIQLLAMMLFDQTFNNTQLNTTFRTILYFYFIVSSYQFAKSLIWFVNFFKHGPICRTILIDCDSITHLRKADIDKQYFRFKPLQKTISVKFTSFNKKQFERVVTMLIKSNKIFNIHMKCDEFEDQLITLASQKKIELHLQNIEFVQPIVQLIAKYQYYNLYFDIKISPQVNQFHEMFLLNQIVQNYQIIPNITENSDVNSKITSFKSVVLQYLIFERYIQNELNFMPKQVFYDVYDE